MLCLCMLQLDFNHWISHCLWMGENVIAKMAENILEWCCIPSPIGTLGFSPRGKGKWRMKLTTHLHLLNLYFHAPYLPSMCSANQRWYLYFLKNLIRNFNTSQFNKKYTSKIHLSTHRYNFWAISPLISCFANSAVVAKRPIPRGWGNIWLWLPSRRRLTGVCGCSTRCRCW
jgi:hypothetical protein